MKDTLSKLEYTLDGTAGTGIDTDPAPTWTVIPIGRIFSDNSQLFQEEPQYADLINGARRVASATGSAQYPVEYNPGADAVLDPLAAALNAGDPVWVRETLATGETLVCGGSTGCYGGVSLARSGYGGFAMRVIDLTAPGAESGDSFVGTAAP